MTPVQKVKLVMNNRLIIIEIKKIGDKKFTIDVSTKIHDDTNNTPFIPLFEQNQPKIFSTAEEALREISDKFVSSIVSIENESSDLLTTEKIVEITGCINIKEV